VAASGGALSVTGLGLRSLRYGRITARDGAIAADPIVPTGPHPVVAARHLPPNDLLVLSIDHVLDHELGQLDHEPAELGVFLAKRGVLRLVMLHAASVRKFATLIVAMTRRRRYMRHG
jgi:hypothetical protein